MKKLMLLGSGELGKEVTISAKRLGCTVIAVDSYANAPAMQVADHSEVINMLDGNELEKVVEKHKPDFIVPEVEAIRTEKLIELEQKGFKIVPTARATNLTMNRDAIRNLAAFELKILTAKFAYAESEDDLKKICGEIGYPCVIKPVMSSSGKGQSVAKNAREVSASWKHAVENMRGDKIKVIAEEFINFHLEITLLTIKQWDGPTLFVTPIGHRQERGDYQESWMPAETTDKQLEEAKQMAKKITDNLGGVGIFGVEFFLTKDKVYFSELSPRPHDTGLVTLISQDLSEFDLHVRAILGLPIPIINYRGPAASAVILADRDSSQFSIKGLDKALSFKNSDVRIFGKPTTRKFRRMGVALATAGDVSEARLLAKRVSRAVEISYQ
ncbi:MAG: formate-dependent phosphoribosylglycinamide formyltransferase [Pseudomonadota bacterium]|nr:formate-dependent phosphoribosylglycinamide formyltransferase [Pseudomonadota bacterium]